MKNKEEYDFKQNMIYNLMKKEYGARYGTSISGWRYAGWIDNNSCFLATKEELIANSLRSDHGELRIIVQKEDGKGVNCFWKEQN